MSSSRIKDILNQLSSDEKRELYERLKLEMPSHELEESLGLSSEAVLASIVTIQKQGGLTWRMLKGVIAEISWGVVELIKYEGWTDVTPTGDFPYDYLVEDDISKVKVQVKLQRSQKGEPFKRKFQKIDEPVFCVETQKTRGGKDALTGELTRPYRYGEFDILAVSLLPYTNKWDSYLYTVANWLLPSIKDSNLIGTFQPVFTDHSTWTDDFDEVVGWFRSGTQVELIP